MRNAVAGVCKVSSDYETAALITVKAAF